DLQSESRLRAILAAMTATVPAHPPLLVKLAPDLPDAGLRAVIETCRAVGVAGLIMTNTTPDRPAGLRAAAAREAGGLSGAPLFRRATAALARARLMAGDTLTLVGVGGVASGADALAKLQAGASLVQLYTALVFAGPGLVGRINAELAAALAAAGFAGPAAATGTDAERIAGWS
ncbi:MAG: quinone-dependent dihydroorotate dehydrogenase, partial [Acetobacteraceae bacterium]